MHGKYGNEPAQQAHICNSALRSTILMDCYIHDFSDIPNETKVGEEEEEEEEKGKNSLTLKN